MQAEFKDGVGPVQPYGSEELMRLLKAKGVQDVKVFKEGSGAHKKAQLDWGKLSKNQKRNIRQALKKGRNR